MKTRRTKIVILLVVAMLASLIFVPPVQAAEGDVEINETNFPDEGFRQFVAQYDENGDGILQVAELEAVTEMECHDANVANMIGIKYFTNLTSLTSFCHELENLDLTGCTNLETLLVAEAFDTFESLDVSSCTNLRKLMCFMCLELDSLNVSGCTKLESLICAHTGVEELDVSSLTNLRRLIYSFSPGRSLDLSACKKLVSLNVDHADLYYLDLSEQKELQKLDTTWNRLAALDVSGLPLLWQFTAGEQRAREVLALKEGDKYVVDLSTLDGVDIANIKDLAVSYYDEGLLPTDYTYDKDKGLLTINVDPGQSEFTYVYDTKANLDKLDHPPADYDEEEDGEIIESTPDLTVVLRIRVIEESPIAPEILENTNENVQVLDDGIVVYQQNALSEDDPSEDEVSEGLSFRIEGNVEDFEYLTLNGQLVARQHYDVKEGSIIVTLKNSYLNSLTPDEYVVRLFTNKSVSSRTILITAPQVNPEQESEDIETDTEDKLPATGERRSLNLWFASILLLAIGSLFLVKLFSVRKGES